MSAIHYKFSSSNDYKNVTFDGVSISLQDCKKAIMAKEKLKPTELDLLITNAQSLQDYKDEAALIPKNTALLVRRIPLGAVPDAKVYVVKRNDTASSTTSLRTESPYLTLDELKKTEDLATANASEQDKIKAMMTQSTDEYDPSKYLKPPKYGSYGRYDNSTLSSYVRCYRCGQTGHYSGQCRLPKTVSDRPKTVRPATGIPRSQTVIVSKETRGALLTPDGQYVVPYVDKKAYETGKKEKPPFLPDTKPEVEDDEEEPVPDELICLLCKEIMQDAVVIPCCGNSYCDECIRNALLDSEDHECPTCHKKNISPDSLIANKFLRQAVNKFRNETGISRKKASVWPRPAAVEVKPPPPQPTKVSYGPPKPKVQYGVSKASPGGAYVVKARTGQVYSAHGYAVKKPPVNQMQAPVKTETPPVAGNEQPSFHNVKSEHGTPTTPADNLSVPGSTPHSNSFNVDSTPESSEKSERRVSEPPPPGVSPEVSDHRVVRNLDSQDESESGSCSRAQAAEEHGSCSSGERPTITGIKPLAPVKTEPQISPLNMMVERPREESPPPPPPPPLPPTQEKQPVGDLLAASVSSPAVAEEDGGLPVTDTNQSEEQLAAASNTAFQLPPAGTSLLDDIPQAEMARVPVSVHGINITLRNAPPAKPEPQNTEQPAQSVPQVPSRPPPIIDAPPASAFQPPPGAIMPPRMSVPPPVLPPRLSVPMPPMGASLPMVSGLSQSMLRLPPLPNIRTSGPPPSMPLTMRPPNMTRPPPNARMSMPPPIGMLPPGMLPPPIPFPPPPGVPPPGFPKTTQAPSQAPRDMSGILPPPPGTGTPPSIPVSDASGRGQSKRHSSKSRSRARKTGHDEGKAKSPKASKSKLELMSAEFTENLQKRKKTSGSRRRARGRRGRSGSRSDSYSSSSYGSSTSRSSSRSSYTSSGSSSSYSSGSYSDSSRSRSDDRRKRRGKARRGKKSKSRSYTRSRSATPKARSQSPGRKRRSKRQPPRRARESKASPKRGSGSRRRNRSPDASPPRRAGGRRDRGKRSRSREQARPARDRRKEGERGLENESVIPGMPPQTVLDYQRDIALYEYYKQKYEHDWLRNRILPPSPFKRFISYDPTKLPPPSAQQTSQPVLRELAPHHGPMPGSQASLLHPFNHPLPPGDATPTEEDAGMFMFHDRTPERFLPNDAPPAPWDPPPFDGNLAERERMLREEEYYMAMQNDIHQDLDRKLRGLGPRRREFSRNRMDQGQFGGARRFDEAQRRRRGHSPPNDRDRRWQRDGQGHRSRGNRSRQEAQDGQRREGRERDRERDRPSESKKRTNEVQKENRSSRRNEERRRRHDRGASQDDKEKSSGTKKKAKESHNNTPAEVPPPGESEPFPPGEGDGTPVRDEAVVEFANETIQIKVINDKAKKSERPAAHPEKRPRSRERIQAKSKREEKLTPDHDRTQIASSKSQKPSASSKHERKSGSRPEPTTTQTEGDVVEQPVEQEASQPLLPEAADKIEATPPAALDIAAQNEPFPELVVEVPEEVMSQLSEKLTAKDQETTEVPEKTSAKPKPTDRKPREERKLKHSSKASHRVVSKLKRHTKTPSPTARSSSPKDNEDVERKMSSKPVDPHTTGLVEVTVAKSRWESDDESDSKPKIKRSEKHSKESPNESPASVTESKPGKRGRQIRIKKVNSAKKGDEPKQSETIRNEKPPEKVSVKKSRPKGREHPAPEHKSERPAGDSRRVVVGDSKGDRPNSPDTKTSRVLRPSISNIDEATFEPDYNDDNSEKALSTYAQSDFDESDVDAKTKAEKAPQKPSTKRGGDRDGKDRESSKGIVQKEATKRSREKDAEAMIDTPQGDSEEAVDEMKKRKKHKKKKKHKKQRKYSQDYDDYDSRENEEAYAESDEYSDEVRHTKTSKDDRTDDGRARKKVSGKRRKTEDDYRDYPVEHGRENSSLKKEKKDKVKGSGSHERVRSHKVVAAESGHSRSKKRPRVSHDYDDEYSDGDERRKDWQKVQKRSTRSPVSSKHRDRKRRVSERDDYSYDDEVADDDYADDDRRSSEMEDRRERKKHKAKKQKHKKAKKEAKEVKTVASRIQRSR